MSFEISYQALGVRRSEKNESKTKALEKAIKLEKDGCIIMNISAVYSNKFSALVWDNFSGVTLQEMLEKELVRKPTVLNTIMR